MPGSAWTDLGGGIRVRQSRAFQMNSGALLDRTHAILVDPGVLPTDLDDLAAAVADARPAALTLFVTHGHWDHVLGRPWWPEAEVIGHDRLAAELAAGEAQVLEAATRLAEKHGERWARGFRAFRPGYAVSGLHYTHRGPWHLVFRDAPGHSDSQLSLHLPDRKLLFAADMLSDVEIPMLDRAPAVYRRTLETLLPLAEHGAIETLVPGHGSIARGAAAVLRRVREDLAYLEELERRAGECTRDGRSADETVAALEVMEYRGKGGGPFPMDEVHRDNTRLAHAAAARPPAESRRRSS